MNYLNPTYLLSRLLEKLGIKTYQERVEFTAHFFAGMTFFLMSSIWSIWIAVAWILYSLIDEFIFDTYKGRDTWIDLISKLVLPIIVGAYIWLR